MSTLNNAWAATKTFFTTNKRWRWLSLALATIILAGLAGAVWAQNTGVTPVRLDPALSFLTEITPKYGVDENLLRCLAKSDSLQASISRPTADKIFTWGNGITLEGSYTFKCFALASNKVKVEWLLDGQKLVLSKLTGTLTGANVGKHRIKLTVSYDTFVDSVEKDFGVEVPNTAPTASILRPRSGTYAADWKCSSSMPYCRIVTLYGSGSDAQEGSLTNGALFSWYLDGKYIGTGVQRNIKLIGKGCGTTSHTITLKVTDSKGLSDTDTVKVSVNTSSMC